MRKMKLPSIPAIRIPILVVLAACEIAGIAYFHSRLVHHQSHGQRDFAEFIALSVMGIVLIVPLLWIDWIRRRGIRYFQVFLVSLCVISFLDAWNNGQEAYLRIWAGFLFVGLVLMSIKMLRPVGKEQQEANLAAIKSGSKELSPVAKYTVLLITWFTLMAWAWSQPQDAIPLWIEILLAPPTLWFAWRLTFHLLKMKRTTADADLRSERGN
jgi:hypothetical protein